MIEKVGEFPQSIIDGFYFALTIGILPVTFYVIFKIMAIIIGIKTNNNHNNHYILGNVVAILLGLLYAFKKDRDSD